MKKQKCRITFRYDFHYILTMYWNFAGLGAYMMTAQRDKPFLQAWAIHRHEALQIRLVVPGRVSAMAVNPTGPKYCVIG